MEASIKDGNIKHFARLLQCASKFGDDLHMCANKEMWELAVTNSTKSAFCLFKLKPEFFCRYKALGVNNVAKRKGVKCQLLVKSMLSVLGKASSVGNVERVDLTIVDPESSLRNNRRKSESSTLRDEEEYEESEGEEVRGIEAKLIMKLVCKHGVTKKHSLHLGSSPFLRAEVHPDSTPSSFDVSARALKDMLDHFSFSTPGFPNSNTAARDNQLGWMFGLREIRMKSWETGNSTLQTEVRIDPGEFDDYVLYDHSRIDLTVPMKEFRAALALAEQLNIQLTIAFSTPGQPLTITSAMENAPHFDMFCAIATTSCEAFANVTLAEEKERQDTKSRTGSVDPSGSVGREGTQIKPSSSLGVTRKQRQPMSLSMSKERLGPTASAVLNVAGGETSARHPNEDISEPLFMPGPSQSDSQQNTSDGSMGGHDLDNTDLPPPSASQTRLVRLSGREMLDVSGMADVDMDQILGELDDADEEDQQEFANTQQRIEAQEGAVMDQTIDGIPGIPRVPGVGESMSLDGLDFHPDDSVFAQGELQEKPHSPRKDDRARNEGGKNLDDDDRSSPVRGAKREEELEEELADDDDLGVSQQDHQEDREFKTFFED